MVLLDFYSILTLQISPLESYGSDITSVSAILVSCSWVPLFNSFLNLPSHFCGHWKALFWSLFIGLLVAGSLYFMSSFMGQLVSYIVDLLDAQFSVLLFSLAESLAKRSFYVYVHHNYFYISLPFLEGKFLHCSWTSFLFLLKILRKRPWCVYMNLETGWIEGKTYGSNNLRQMSYMGSMPIFLLRSLTFSPIYKTHDAL